MIFDVDMTICDTSIRKRMALERTLMDKSKKPEEIMDKMLRYFFFDEDLIKTDVPLDGAVETLQKLSDGYKIYYLTGRPSAQTAKDFLRRYRFPIGPVFATMVKPGESEKKVALFREILDDAKVNGREAVSIADLPGDAIAAKGVGIRTIGTCQARKNAKERLECVCDIIIDEIGKLPEALMLMDE